MDLKILPSALSGSITVPESKSVTHRLIIALAISKFQSKDYTNDENPIAFLEELLNNPSDDIIATLQCCQNLALHNPAGDCRNSGTTFRLLLPIFAVLFDCFTLSVGQQLSNRPINTLIDALAQGGCAVTSEELSFHGNGLFTGGTYSLPGNISSQYISALLFALPLTEEGGTLKITTQLESRPYVDLTLKVLKDFNIKIYETSKEEENIVLTTFKIPGKQQYFCPFDNKIEFEKDWSSAAFWYGANFTGQSINIENMNFSSLQGDKEILNILKNYESDVDLTIDVQHIPDLVPILAVAASYRKSGSKVFFTNTKRLKIKESDREMSTMHMIKALGGIVQSEDNGFSITAVELLKGGTVDTFNDHRIAMAAAIAGCKSIEGAIIKNYSCVEKSYPDFFDHLIQLGGNIAKL